MMYKITIQDPTRENKLLIFHSKEFPIMPGRLITFTDIEGDEQTWLLDLLVNIKKVEDYVR